MTIINGYGGAFYLEIHPNEFVRNCPKRIPIDGCCLRYPYTASGSRKSLFDRVQSIIPAIFISFYGFGTLKGSHSSRVNVLELCYYYNERSNNIETVLRADNRTIITITRISKINARRKLLSKINYAHCLQWLRSPVGNRLNYWAHELPAADVRCNSEICEYINKPGVYYHWIRYGSLAFHAYGVCFNGIREKIKNNNTLLSV